jgi:hypothetical protein
MGIETIALAALGVGSSIMSSNSQNSAARNATAALNTNAQAERDSALEIYNMQRADYEPFRQYEIQQANAMGELFGFNPVGQPATQSPVPGLPGSAVLPRGLGSGLGVGGGAGRNLGDTSMPQLRQQAPNFNSAEPGVNALAMRGGGMASIQGGGVGFNQSGVGQATLPGATGQPGNVPGMNALDPSKFQTTATVGGGVPGAAATGSQPLFDSSLGGADRFNNSLFNPMAQTLFNTQRDNIDNNLAGQGLVYSSARQNAVQQAGVNSSQNALSMYLNALSGAPQMQATQGGANALANYGQQIGNTYQNQGAAQAQSAYNQGQSNSDMWGGIGSAGAFALGGR